MTVSQAEKEERLLLLQTLQRMDKAINSLLRGGTDNSYNKEMAPFLDALKTKMKQCNTE